MVFNDALISAGSVDVYFASNKTVFSISTTVKTATLGGIKTANINATDLALVA